MCFTRGLVGVLCLRWFALVDLLVPGFGLVLMVDAVFVRCDLY